MFFSSIPTSSSGWAYGQLIPLTKEIWVGDGFQGKRTLLTFLSSNKVILSSMQFTQFCQFQSTKKFNLYDYWYLKCAFAANEQSKCVFLLSMTNASMRTNLRLLENLKRLHFWQLWQLWQRGGICNSPKPFAQITPNSFSYLSQERYNFSELISFWQNRKGPHR